MESMIAERKRKTAVGQAHGKLILIGEHAVVHGYPAIAIPFTQLGVTAQVTAIRGPLMVDCDFYYGPLMSAPKSLRGLSACIRETLKCVHHSEKGLMVRLTSSIPSGRGLGSSAAVAAAHVRAISSYQGDQLTHDDFIALVNIAETYAHGTPSGIDAEAVNTNRPFWFVKGQAIKPLSVKRPLHFVIADSGKRGDTSAAVSTVRAKLVSTPQQTQARLEQLGQLSNRARNALAIGDTQRLGSTLNQAQMDLKTLGVSDAHLDRLISAANRAGAVGAKLTGSGRGGCMLALAWDSAHAEELEATLYNAGAHAVWCFTVGERSCLL